MKCPSVVKMAMGENPHNMSDKTMNKLIKTEIKRLKSKNVKPGEALKYYSSMGWADGLPDMTLTDRRWLVSHVDKKL